MAAEKCFFNGKVNSCPGSKEKLSICGRIKRIIEASDLRGHHDIHDSLEVGFNSGTVTHIQCHKNCVSTYVSPQNLAHVSQKRTPNSSSEPKAKKLRCHTMGPSFDLKKHCLYCLDVTECKLDCEYDVKTPVQSRVPASRVETTKMGDGQVAYTLIPSSESV